MSKVGLFEKLKKYEKKSVLLSTARRKRKEKRN